MDASLQLALERSAQEASDEERLLVRALAESAAAATATARATAAAAAERAGGLAAAAAAYGSAGATGPSPGAGTALATNPGSSSGGGAGARGIVDGFVPAYDLYSYSDVRGAASSSPDIRRWAAADDEDSGPAATAFSARELHALDALDQHIDSLSLVRPSVLGHDHGHGSGSGNVNAPPAPRASNDSGSTRDGGSHSGWLGSGGAHAARVAAAADLNSPAGIQDQVQPGNTIAFCEEEMLQAALAESMRDR